jgi:hypothetical protein
MRDGEGDFDPARDTTVRINYRHYFIFQPCQLHALGTFYLLARTHPHKHTSTRTQATGEL